MTQSADRVRTRIQRLCRYLPRDALQGRRIGLEKESLRVDSDGVIAQSPHPRSLGAPLTHPYITTDFSEALMELITPPMPDARSALEFLDQTQRYVVQHMPTEEILWCASMPCVVRGETSIPIARYGRSNAGTMKTVYRRGLGYRYGRTMQTIAGIHFNFSLPETFWRADLQASGQQDSLRTYTDARYFGLLRNLLRVGWLIPYLFGASPAVCKSFVGGQPFDMLDFNDNTFYAPDGTSLRMGDIGYQNNIENEIGVKACYDSLEAYVESLRCATETPAPAYEKIGVKVDGRYRQLNANLLQIENEYYSTVRPKQVPGVNEKPSLALHRRGVRYIELRSLDVNPFEPLGVTGAQLRFIEALLLWCLLEDSPALSEREQLEVDENELTVAQYGRRRDVNLRRDGRDVPLRQWAEEILRAMAPVCEWLDADQGGQLYVTALAVHRRGVESPECLPSARLLHVMREAGEGFVPLALEWSRRHQAWFRDQPVAQEMGRTLTALEASSRQRQQQWEAADSMDFDEYLATYFDQTLADES